jgi:hypothetical protein
MVASNSQQSTVNSQQSIPNKLPRPTQGGVGARRLFCLSILFGLFFLILPACSKQSSNPPSSPFEKGRVEGDFSSHDLYLITRIVDDIASINKLNIFNTYQIYSHNYHPN